jgi:polar amino acid transport system substrate-binding protein
MATMRTRTIPLAALPLLLGLAACHGQGHGQGHGPAGTVKGLAAIKARGVVRVAMTGMYPPFNFYDDHNQLTGFDVDVTRAVAGHLGVKPKLITLKWSGIIAGLAARRYDLIIGSMAITPQREKAVDFSAPYYVSGAQIFALAGRKVAKQGNLDGAIVGVNLGTTYEQALRKHQEVKEIRTYSGIPEILVDLQAHRLDAFVTDRLVGLWAAKTRHLDLKLVGPPLYTEHMGIAMQKGQPKLEAAVNAALAQMHRDGTYRRLSEKWFGRDIAGKPAP